MAQFTERTEIIKTPWTIRPATADDRHAIARHRYFGDAEQQTDLDAYAAWVADAIRAGRYIGLLVGRAGDVVAGAGITMLDWGPTRGDSSADRGRIVNVFTSPSWRRHGIARQLVTDLTGIAEARGINTFSLGATEDAAGMYTQLGFAPYQNEMLRREKGLQT